MTITFDRELELRLFKNESCSKWRNETRDYPQRGFGPKKFSKISLFTIFLVFSDLFFYFTFVKKIWKLVVVFPCILEIYQRILQNFGIFIFKKKILR